MAFDQIMGISQAYSLTPSNTNDILTTLSLDEFRNIWGVNSQGARLFIGGAGDVKVDMLGGETVTLTGLAVGVWHPMFVTKVYQTGTTATNIFVGW